MIPQVTEGWLKKRETLLVFLVFLFGTFLRFYDLGRRQLWLDEIIQLQRFSHPTFRENIASVMTDIAAAPLDYIIQSVFVAMWGQSEFSARFHAALLGSLSLVLFYFLSKRLFPRRASLIGMLLLATYPVHHHYAQEGRNYALFVFLALCCYYLLTKALEARGARWWVLFFAMTTCLFYTNYLAGLLVVTQGAFLACLTSARVRNSLPFPSSTSVPRLFLFFVLAAGAAAVLFVPWLITTYEYAKGNFGGTLSDPKLPLVMFKEISGGGYPLSLLLFLFFCLGIRQLIRTQRWASVCLVLCWFLVPIPIIVFLDWYRDYYFAVRQFLFVTPALFFGVAVGIDGLPVFMRTESAGKKLRVISTMLIVAISVGAIYRHRDREQADWKGVAGYLRAHVKNDDLICAPNSSFSLAYYYPEINQRQVEVEELADRKLGIARTDRLAQRTTYLVESIYLTPEQKLSVERLLESVSVLEEKSFNGFAIYHLRLKRE